MTEGLSVADVLERAADLITPEGAWTQGTWARDESGRSVTLRSPYAACFCMRGALVIASNKSMASEMTGVQKALGFRNAAAMARWNDRDSRTQAEVVAKLREAAELARSVQS